MCSQAICVPFAFRNLLTVSNIPHHCSIYVLYTIKWPQKAFLFVFEFWSFNLLIMGLLENMAPCCWYVGPFMYLYLSIYDLIYIYILIGKFTICFSCWFNSIITFHSWVFSFWTETQKLWSLILASLWRRWHQF